MDTSKDQENRSFDTVKATCWVKQKLLCGWLLTKKVDTKRYEGEGSHFFLVRLFIYSGCLLHNNTNTQTELILILSRTRYCPSSSESKLENLQHKYRQEEHAKAEQLMTATQILNHGVFSQSHAFAGWIQPRNPGNPLLLFSVQLNLTSFSDLLYNPFFPCLWGKHSRSRETQSFPIEPHSISLCFDSAGRYVRSGRPRLQIHPTFSGYLSGGVGRKTQEDQAWWRKSQYLIIELELEKNVRINRKWTIWQRRNVLGERNWLTESNRGNTYKQKEKQKNAEIKSNSIAL